MASTPTRDVCAVITSVCAILELLQLSTILVIIFTICTSTNSYSSDSKISPPRQRMLQNLDVLAVTYVFELVKTTILCHLQHAKLRAGFMLFENVFPLPFFHKRTLSRLYRPCPSRAWLQAVTASCTQAFLRQYQREQWNSFHVRSPRIDLVYRPCRYYWH